MLGFTTFLSLALSAPLVVSGLVMKRSGCAVGSAALSSRLPSALAAPATTAANFVGVAIGTQNYTCASTGTYTNVGAFAELFDVSCLVNAPLFASLPDLAMAAWEAAPPAVPISELISLIRPLQGSLVLGQHYYVPNPLTGSGINPEWDFTSGIDAGKKDAFVVAAKTTSMPAPTGSKDIDWVLLTALAGEGALAQQVYRTDTRLGQPPASCTPGSPEIVVKYAAKYWGFGGSLGSV